MLSVLVAIAGLVLPHAPTPTAFRIRATQPAMAEHKLMLDLLNKWDDDEDGDSLSCVRTR